MYYQVNDIINYYVAWQLFEDERFSGLREVQQRYGTTPFSCAIKIGFSGQQLPQVAQLLPNVVQLLTDFMQLLHKITDRCYLFKKVNSFPGFGLPVCLFWYNSHSITEVQQCYYLYYSSSTKFLLLSVWTVFILK